jgi:Protein of unknown function (DUF1592)/Protein of unknown function (DUF1588)/Protein of unknown function (DUF1585)/Protein of unknown function (DUF1587)/Protein of unknown function (DUF1595)
MPPAGLPRPDDATYNSTAAWLETGLDRASAEHVELGKLPLLHRLSRTEYENAIRDLLGLDALPQEMNYSLLLPPDNASSGFDNLADLLFVSPTAMESYLEAARKISRLAVGDPSMPVMVNTYRLSGEHTQDIHEQGLPFGTRGGLGVRTDVPLDGDYVFKVELAGPAREQDQVEVTVDGARAQLVEVGEKPQPGAAPRGFRGPQKPLEIHVPLKAGPRMIGVTFVQKSEARDEETVRPRMRGRGTELAIDIVTISGPYHALSQGQAPDHAQAAGETPSRRKIFVCHPSSAADERACAKQILLSLERHAYRRPVSDADLQDVMPFYEAGRKDGSFDRGIEQAVERLLVSPQFLFRIERDPSGIAPGTPFRVSDLELASRLSFFLWSSLPDDELLNVAVRGKLKDPVVLEREVRRMLADPRSESLVTNFAEQWLYVRDIDSKKPDELLFPDFDETLRSAFRRETDLFLDSILRGNHSVLDLMTANYTFVNERLAKHYGIPNVEGTYFRRITFPADSPRGGLLGQGSILTLTSYATRTSPVLRGKWILENILSSPPPPPPPNVPALKTEANDSGKPLTMRQAMVAHRANPVCASCHARMDPIGFAMDNFDAVGRWRDTDAGQAIDASGVLPEGTKFSGVAELKKALLRNPEQFVDTITEKLLMYAIARNVQYYDRPAIRAIVRQAAASNYTLASLVLGVVKSAPFQMRKSQPEEPVKPGVTTAALN